MFFVGKPSVKAKRLADITYECLMLGIAQVKPGNRLGDIGHAIQKYAEEKRCSIVTEFCGHGLGRIFHDAPNVMHYGSKGMGVELKEGMIFTIEPMINLGRVDTKVLDDGWTAVTRDKKLSMQFEHSLGVTPEGCEIFTVSPKGRHKPPYSF
jgi:methionyl aminopeptidase